MCNPILVQGGLGVATAVSSFAQNNAAADAVNAGRRAEAELNKQLAENAARRQYSGLSRRRVENRAAAAQEIESVSLQALKATGLARVSAGAGGAAGQSVAALLADITTQEARFRGNVVTRQAFEDAQFEQEREAIGDQLVGRLFSSQFRPVSEPSFLNLALGVGSSIFESINDNPNPSDTPSPAGTTTKIP